MNKEEYILDEWRLYEAGLQYNQAIITGDKSYYDTIDVNIAFANDDQWRNVEAEDISKPMIPILQKAKQHTIANLTSTSISATISPLEYNADKEKVTPEMQSEIDTTDMANAEIRNLLDKVKYEFKIRAGLGDAFDMGDFCLHNYWDRKAKPFKGKYKATLGDIETELVDGPNIMFGNANNPDPQIQPYIIVIGRDIAMTLQDEAKEYKMKNDYLVEEDEEWLYQAGDNGKIEVETDKYGKALYIIIYKKDKKTGEILATKCVKNAYIYKNEKTGLHRYPIAWFNYKKQKNQYHGRAGATGLIPNQIAVNKLLAMVVYSVMKTAFPTLVYDAGKMSAPTNEVGKAIGLKNMKQGESVKQVADYLNVGQVSNQVITIIELIMNYTKDMLGINDAAVGNVTPDNTSAIALAEKLTSVPLENIRSNLYEVTEQFVDNLLDMIGTKYGTRPVVVHDGDNTQIVPYNFSLIKEMNYNKRIDVGAIGYASELTSIKELRGLLDLGAISVVDYLERMPENSIPQVKELIEEIKSRTGVLSAQEQVAQDDKFEQMMAFIETLPPEIQEQLKALPDEELEAQVAQMMEQGGNTQGEQTELNTLIGG